MRRPLEHEKFQHFDLSSYFLPYKQGICDNKWCANFAITFFYPVGYKIVITKPQLSSGRHKQHFMNFTQYTRREINKSKWNTAHFALIYCSNLLWQFVITLCYDNLLSYFCLVVADAQGTLFASVILHKIFKLLTSSVLNIQTESLMVVHTNYTEVTIDDSTCWRWTVGTVNCGHGDLGASGLSYNDVIVQLYNLDRMHPWSPSHQFTVNKHDQRQWCRSHGILYYYVCSSVHTDRDMDQVPLFPIVLDPFPLSVQVPCSANTPSVWIVPQSIPCRNH